MLHPITKKEQFIAGQKKTSICEGSTVERCKPAVLIHSHSRIKYKAKQQNRWLKRYRFWLVVAYYPVRL